MPRLLPNYEQRIENESLRSISLVFRAESLFSDPTQKLSIHDLHRLYESIFLTFFCRWEAVLEEAAIRYICGYQPRNAMHSPWTTVNVASLSDAKTVLFGGHDYLLWSHPRRCKRNVSNYIPGSPLERSFDSNYAFLENVGFIRNGIAHRTDDAKSKVDTACRHFVGRTFRGSRCGVALRYRIDPTNNISLFQDLLSRMQLIARSFS